MPGASASWERPTFNPSIDAGTEGEAKTMYEKLKALFDGKESLTLAEFEAGAKDLKLVDLADGEYVKKEKLDRALEAKAEAAAKIKELEDSAGGDEALKAQIDALTKQNETTSKALEAAESKAAKIERERVVESKVGDRKFTRFATLEAEALMDDSTDFDEALDKWLEANPEYGPKQEGDDQGKPPAAAAKVKTGDAPKGSPAPDDAEFEAFTEGLGVPAEKETE